MKFKLFPKHKVSSRSNPQMLHLFLPKITFVSIHTRSSLRGAKPEGDGQRWDSRQSQLLPHSSWAVLVDAVLLTQSRIPWDSSSWLDLEYAVGTLQV